MNSITLCKNARQFYLSVAKRYITVSSSRLAVESVENIIHAPENLELASLNYEKRRNDPIHIKKARLLYQSRKRGMLENGILLASFAHQYLPILNDTQIDEYDKIINLPSNDWDIFYWAMGMRPTPPEFDNSVMDLLKKHIKTAGNDARIGQPPLDPV